MATYDVVVRWVAVATVRVDGCDDPETACELAKERGLPWSEATEGDDGGPTTWTAMPTGDEGCTCGRAYDHAVFGDPCGYCVNGVEGAK